MKKELIKLANYLNKADLRNEALFVYNIAKKSSYTDIDDIPQSLLKSYTDSHKSIRERVEESNKASEKEEDRSYISAITRTKPSAPCRYLHSENLLKGRILDYGCGKGMDTHFLKEEGFDVEKYDLHHHPNLPEGKFDTIMCNYVFNVLDKKNRDEVFNKIEEYLNEGGLIYISVRNDLKQEVTKRKGYNQYRVNLPENRFDLIKKTPLFKMFKFPKSLYE